MGLPSIKRNTTWTVLLMGCLIIAVAIGLGKLILKERGQTDNLDSRTEGATGAEENTATAEKLVQPPPNPVTVVKKRIKGMSAKNIKRSLKYLTKTTHVGGTDGEEELGDWIYNKWERAGFDKVEKKGYDALLSYPSRKPNERNKVEILDMDEERDEYVTIYETTPEYEDPTVNNDEILPAYHAYAKAGIVTGDLVFVNHCRVDDFERLISMNVTIEGNIAICRNGQIYRGDMTKNAANFGCVGLILYTEPNLLAQWFNLPTYPDGLFLPDTGIQRGSILLKNGDPQTPGYPALGGMHRTSVEKLNLPTIPVQPISQLDARALMMRLVGDDGGHYTWIGSLPNVSYSVGPGFVNQTEKVRLSVYNKLEVRKIYNIIGTIYGRTEQDRYVLIGNHRDAWAYGAIDPSGATAIMMEIAEVFGSLKKKMNWRPRRTLMFCSWAAEEFGLIGSHEFMEPTNLCVSPSLRTPLLNYWRGIISDITRLAVITNQINGQARHILYTGDYGRIMGSRAVAYLNMDILVQGNFTIEASASPNFRDALFEAARMVPDPDGSDMTFYDIWRERQFLAPAGEPRVATLGAGSDYASFVGQGGISSMNAIYVPNHQTAFYSLYPLYHTRYDTFYMVKNMIDPDFIYHKAMGQFYGSLLLIMSNSKILPFNCREYAADLASQFELLNQTHGAAFAQQDIDLSDMAAVIEELKEATKEFHRRLNFIDISQPLEVRRANDQLMMFERAFIDPVGLPDRPFTRNVIYAHSHLSRYNSAKFPGVVDTMFQLQNDENPDPELWTTVREQISTVIHAIRSAIYTLEPYHVTD